MNPERRKQLKKGLRATELALVNAMLETTDALHEHVKKMLKSGVPLEAIAQASLASAFITGVKYMALHASELPKDHPDFPLQAFGEIMQESVAIVCARVGMDSASNPKGNPEAWRN